MPFGALVEHGFLTSQSLLDQDSDEKEACSTQKALRSNLSWTNGGAIILDLEESVQAWAGSWVVREYYPCDI